MGVESRAAPDTGADLMREVVYGDLRKVPRMWLNESAFKSQLSTINFPSTTLQISAATASIG